ncbi:aminopeptidase N C-terminal domain-containing protein, partial [Legionella sp.]|uniref:aminopeptidase N C-terminal domain-containing protein n=1 Tax=Legionella sp. TaxID=459 RepID=UPI003D0ACDC5
VLDKWFAIQAASELPDALEQVRKLLKHPDFSIKNPNKARSVIGAFCMANPRNFHAPDGSGYQFLAEMLLILDKLNPQIAARMASPFTRWQRYDKPRQMLMRQQLEQLATQSLSRDLAEVVSKSLVAEIK